MSNCSVCGKPKDNHPYRHPFTGMGDKLVLPDTKAENADAQNKPSAEVAQLFGVVQRLLTMLVAKNVLTNEEASYVLFGPTPPPSK
mgnify:CR=1 FL=1